MSLTSQQSLSAHATEHRMYIGLPMLGLQDMRGTRMKYRWESPIAHLGWDAAPYSEASLGLRKAEANLR